MLTEEVPSPTIAARIAPGTTQDSAAGAPATTPPSLRVARRRTRSAAWRRLRSLLALAQRLARRTLTRSAPAQRPPPGLAGWLLAGLQRYPLTSLAALLTGYLLFPAPLLEPALFPLAPAAPSPAIRLVGGAGLAVVLAMLAALLEPALLRLRGARPLSFEEASRLQPLVERAALSMGLAVLPRLLAWEQRGLAPAVYLRHLVVATDLLDEPDDEQVMGLLAHALAHWQSLDGLGRYLIVLLGLPLSLAYGVTDALVRLLRGLMEAERPMVLFAALAGLLLAIPWLYSRLWFVALAALARWEGGHHELEADLVALRARTGSGLLRALQRLRTMPDTGRGLDMLLTAEPLPTKRRLEILARALKRAEYRSAGRTTSHPLLAR